MQLSYSFRIEFIFASECELTGKMIAIAAIAFSFEILYNTHR